MREKRPFIPTFPDASGAQVLTIQALPVKCVGYSELSKPYQVVRVMRRSFQLLLFIGSSEPAIPQTATYDISDRHRVQNRPFDFAHNSAIQAVAEPTPKQTEASPYISGDLQQAGLPVLLRQSVAEAIRSINVSEGRPPPSF